MTSDEDKDCLSVPICCSEMHPLPKLDLFSVAAHSRVRFGATGDYSLAISILAWGCRIASSKENCRPSLACLGNTALGSLCVEGEKFADSGEDLKCKMQQIYYQAAPCSSFLQGEEMKQMIRSVKKQNGDAQPSLEWSENQWSTSLLSCKTNTLPS